MSEENAEVYPNQVANLARVQTETVQAEMVRMAQSAAGAVSAEDAELQQSLAYEVRAQNLAARQSVLFVARAEEATLRESGAAFVRAGTVSLNGCAGVVLADRTELSDTYAALVAAREVRGEKIESLILLSPRVEGSVTTVMDARGAAIAGLFGGLFAGFLFLLGRMWFGRK